MKSLLTFVVGLTIGAGVSWVYHKNKYEEMIKDEVEDLREHYKGKERKPKNREEVKEQVEKMTSEEYDIAMGRVHSLVRENKYETTDDSYTTKCEDAPFVVSPEEFTNMPGYDVATFYYHTDDIISNDNNEMLDCDEIERLFGMPAVEIKEEFGVHEDDSVFIRNMQLKCDYEILRDEGIFIKRNGD